MSCQEKETQELFCSIRSLPMEDRSKTLLPLAVLILRMDVCWCSNISLLLHHLVLAIYIDTMDIPSYYWVNTWGKKVKIIYYYIIFSVILYVDATIIASFGHSFLAGLIINWRGYTLTWEYLWDVPDFKCLCKWIKCTRVIAFSSRWYIQIYFLWGLI